MNIKIFSIFLISLVLLGLIYYLNPHVDFYNTEFLYPFFWTLLPISILLLFISELKNIKIKNIIITILIFGIVSSFILSNINTTCSDMICFFNRGSSALWLSASFSLVYYFVLRVKSGGKIDSN